MEQVFDDKIFKKLYKKYRNVSPRSWRVWPGGVHESKRYSDMFAKVQALEEINTGEEKVTRTKIIEQMLQKRYDEEFN